MKEKCRYITNQGEQCTRIPKGGKLCWQHSTIKQTSFFILFCTIITLVLNLTKIASTITNFFYNSNELICDRVVDEGCTLNYSSKFVDQTGDHFTKVNTTKDLFMILKLGNEFIPTVIKQYSKPIRSLESNIVDLPPCFPDLNYLHKPNEDIQTIIKYSNCSMSIYLVNEQVQFEGKLIDIKTDEIIGWFDGNEFGVREACSLSWNKDENGVEIIDKYGNVTFSVNLKKYISKDIKLLKGFFSADIYKDNYLKSEETYVLEFRGYFKIEDEIFVFGDDLTITDSINIALKEIKKIQPYFDHFGKNSTGKRL